MPRDKVTAALHQDGAVEQVQGKVAQLQKELQAAELEESLVKATVTTNILCSDLTPKECKEGAQPVLGPTLKTEIQVEGKALKECKEGAEPVLGPTLKTEIQVEGKVVEALIDTGSPVSLVSIDFLLQALKAQIGTAGTPAEQAQALKRRMEPPTTTIRNFGGQEVNVICQAAITLARGKFKCHTTVLVQKGTALDMLLGTDILGQLGFKVLQV